MSEILIIYVSNTGNTEAMAKAVEEGVKTAGGSAFFAEADKVDVDRVKNAKVLALGCPACGSEELDEAMESLMDQISDSLSDKTIGLFGSYGWGDGEWMKNWETSITEKGAKLYSSAGVIVNGEPDDSILEQCKEMGEKLVSGN